MPLLTFMRVSQNGIIEKAEAQSYSENVEKVVVPCQNNKKLEHDLKIYK